MGLDLYVGPLTRYYAQDWETIVQRMGREQGMPVRVVRLNDAGSPPDTADVREDVIAWRRQLQLEFGDRLREPLGWDESPTGDYFTDKPDWDAYTAVQLLAAHEEFPDVAPPGRIGRSEDTSRLPLMRRLRDADPRRAPSLKERLRGRGVPAKTDWQYAHVLFPELWLPAAFERELEATDLGGTPVIIGSVPRLLDELRALNAATLRADEHALEAARMAGPPEDGDFGRLARFGLAVQLQLVEAAARHRLPMKLDY